jgi:ribosome-associated toxin RatA of RatAB toxin-antitoxin module
MSTVQHAIEVSAPLHAVYEQLADLENYPQFMSGVEEAVQVSDDRAHWIMDLEGARCEFDAEIVERAVDQRVTWRSTAGPALAETITLRPMGEMRTQVIAQLEADVAALMPTDRHAQETLARRLKADLSSFKAMIELGAGMDMPTPMGGMASTGMGGTTSTGMGGMGSPGTGGGGRIVSGSAMTGPRTRPAMIDLGSPKAVAERIARSRAAEAARVMGHADEDERGSTPG